MALGVFHTEGSGDKCGRLVGLLGLALVHVDVAHFFGGLLHGNSSWSQPAGAPSTPLFDGCWIFCMTAFVGVTARAKQGRDELRWRLLAMMRR